MRLDQRLGFQRVWVTAIRRYGTIIGAHHRVHDFGMCGSPVVAREVGEWFRLLHERSVDTAHTPVKLGDP